jgi:hypothetical protein
MTSLPMFSEGVPIKEFTGVIIGEFMSHNRASILTSSEAVCDGRGKLLLHKVHINLLFSMVCISLNCLLNLWGHASTFLFDIINAVT